MGNDDDTDFELEMLRQAALNSLKQNRAKKESSKRVMPPQHRPVANNRNLIEIQTQGNLLDNHMMGQNFVQEIVIAEGLDVDDSDCDEVIEEVIMSDEDSLSLSSSPLSDDHCHMPNSNPSEESPAGPPPKVQVDSSSDDDALSVASRYSLYEDDLDDNKDLTHRLAVRVRLPGKTTVTSSSNKHMDDEKDRNVRSRSKSRSKERDRLSAQLRGSRSPPPMRKRRLRTRSRSPFRRRPRPTSRCREYRRRSVSIGRDIAARTDVSRDRPRRTEDSRRAYRSSPPQSSRRDYCGPSRRRSRNRSLSRERIQNINSESLIRTQEDKETKKSDSESRKSKSPEISHVPGVDQEVLEKRRRKFLGKQPLQKVELVEGKTIRLHQHSKSSSGNKDEILRHRNVVESVQKQSHVVLKTSGRDVSPQATATSTLTTSSNSSLSPGEKSVSKRKLRDGSPTGLQIKVDQEPEPEQEDLRAKLIKKKLKAQQQGQHLGSGRIFSEALKGTRLISGNSSTSNNKGDSRSVSKQRVQKRKVSMTFA